MQATYVYEGHRHRGYPSLKQLSKKQLMQQSVSIDPIQNKQIPVKTTTSPSVTKDDDASH